MDYEKLKIKSFRDYDSSIEKNYDPLKPLYGGKLPLIWKHF